MWKVLIALPDARERAEVKRIILESSRPLELVGEAADGAAALVLAATEEPDLLIVDARLPDLPAMEMLRRIQRLDSEAPVLVMAGSQDIEAARESIAVGATDYILKPLDREALLQSLDAALEGLRELRDTERYMRRAREELARSLPLLREAFIRDLLAGRKDPGNVDKDLDYLMMDLPPQPSLLLLGLRSEEFRNLDLTEGRLRVCCLKALLEESFPAALGNHVFEDGEGRLGVLGVEAAPGDWAATASDAAERASRRFGLELETVIGSAPDLYSLPEAWADLREALGRDPLQTYHGLWQGGGARI